MYIRVLRFTGKLGCFIAVCALLAGADSLQLRNGRHLQGKYIGGSPTAIGFMSGGSVEYFTTSDVLVLIFDNTNETPLRGIQPNPMKGWPPAEQPGIVRRREMGNSTQDCDLPTGQGGTVASKLLFDSNLKPEECEPNLRLIESRWEAAGASSPRAWQLVAIALW